MKFLICFILINILFVFSSLFEMQMLQQNSYNDNNHFYNFFLEDLKTNYKMYLLKYGTGIIFVLLFKINILLFIVLLFVLLILIYDAVLRYLKFNDKKPLKFTKRMIRICLLDYILLLVIELLSVKLSVAFFIGISLIYIAFNSFVLIFIVYLLKPIEKLIYLTYKSKATKKLGRMNNLKVIGITGSFGKTSTKMILESILKTTYKGFYTPASFNTPNGILMTINQEKTIFNDYFIAEMGAKKCGEIEELCDIVYPQYGIITSIGAAHLETFKSLENVQKTKFELLESLPHNGVAVLNKDDEMMVKYKPINTCKVIWVGIENDADVMAKDIKVSSDGTSFTIYFKEENKKIKVSTILLGNKNIYNILEAVALSHLMGVSEKNIIKGVSNIKPIEHRLEIKKQNNITILDDSFNSNPVGAKNALDVLSLMEEEKVIITPGMIEMGSEEYNLNKEFGKQIAKVCDKVFLVGKKQTRAIYEGLMEKKYPVSKVVICSSFKEAYNEFIRLSGNKKVTVLFENDLPDTYTEE